MKSNAGNEISTISDVNCSNDVSDDNSITERSGVLIRGVDDVLKRQTVREMVARQRRRLQNATTNPNREHRIGVWCACSRAADHSWDDNVAEEDRLAYIEPAKEPRAERRRSRRGKEQTPFERWGWVM